MKSLIEDSKKYIISSITLGIIIITTIFLNGCNKISEDDIFKIKDQERKLEDICHDISFTTAGIDNSVFELAKDDVDRTSPNEVYISHMSKCMDKIEEYKKYTDYVDISQIKRYYDSFVKEGTITQEQADEYYDHVEFERYYIDRIYNYYKEMVKYSEDGELSDEEIKYIFTINDSVLNPNSPENELKKFIDDKCLVSSEKFYKLRDYDDHTFNDDEYVEWLDD